MSSLYDKLFRSILIMKLSRIYIGSPILLSISLTTIYKLSILDLAIVISIDYSFSQSLDDT